MFETHIEDLKEDLRGELSLNLDKYLKEEAAGRYSAGFLGIRLESVFQPIVDATLKRTIGHEALLRASVGGLASISPQMAFEYAQSNGKLVKFDRICRTLHLLNSLKFGANSALLFVNVHPELLESVDSHGRVFEQILKQHSVPTHRVVIEITHSRAVNETSLHKAMNNYRDCGYKVAIDDFGARGTDFGRIWRLEPDYIKTDVALVRELDSNPKLPRVFPKLLAIIRDSGAEEIVQGIESEKQQSCVLAAGARILQGNLLGLPQPSMD